MIEQKCDTCDNIINNTECIGITVGTMYGIGFHANEEYECICCSWECLYDYLYKNKKELINGN